MTAFGPRTYGTNDNFAIFESARAGLPTPDSYMLSTGVLQGLYGRWPSFPWMGIALWAGVIIAGIGFAHLSCRAFSGFWERLLACSLVSILLVPSALRLDYNDTSILLGASGVLLLAFEPGARLSPPLLLWASAACLQAYATRRLGFYGAVCFVAPIATLGARRLSGRRLMQGAGVAAVLLVVAWVDARAYHTHLTGSYGRFVEFNEQRRKLHNTPYLTSGVVDPSALVATHWSANDYWLFCNWYYLDEDRFNPATAGALRAFIRDGNPLPPSLGRGFGIFVSSYGRNLAELALAAALAAAWGRRRSWIAILLAATAFSIGAGLMETYWQFPLHIGNPYFTMAILALIVSPRVPEPASSGRWTIVSFILVGVLIVATAAPLSRLFAENRQHRLAYETIARRLAALPGDSVVLVEGGTLRLDWSDPIAPEEAQPKLIRTGMGIFSPLFYDALSKVGLKRANEVLPFLARRAHGYLLASEQSIPHLVLFAREAAHLEVNVQRLEQLPSGDGIYRLSTASPIASP